jgi:hypothetical protein
MGSKIRWMFFALWLVSSVVTHAVEYRDFMDTQGRTIRARILSYDSRSSKLKIERDNKVTATVPITGFSEEDQTYIKNWLKFEGIRSTTKFKVSAERKGLKSWANERIGTISYSDGSVEHNQVVGKTDFDEVGYEITLDNRNKYPVENLVLKYNIYYEQEVSAREKDPRPFVLFGTIPINSIPAQSKQTVKTESVTVYKDESNAEFVNSRIIRGKVLGISCRICADVEGSESVLRQEGMPKTMVTSKAWSSSSNLSRLPKHKNEK